MSGQNEEEAVAASAMPEEEEQKGEAVAAASAMPVSSLPWPESAVSPDTARVGPILCESGRV